MVYTLDIVLSAFGILTVIFTTTLCSRYNYCFHFMDVIQISRASIMKLFPSCMYASLLLNIEHLGCFQYFAIINSAAMNFLGISLHTCRVVSIEEFLKEKLLKEFAF